MRTYLAVGRSVTIAAGQTSATIPLTPQDDTDVEGDETVILTLAVDQAYTIGSQDNATVTIADDDGAPVSYSISDVAKREGRTGKLTTFTFTVTRSGSDLPETTLYFETMDGTATVADIDYQATSGNVYFAAGATTATITVKVVGDLDSENAEEFYVRLLSGQGGVELAIGTGTILNDDK